MKLEMETVLDALDGLALALVGESHTWTEDERQAYVRAVSILQQPRHGEAS